MTREYIEDNYPNTEMLLAEGLDAAIIGVDLDNYKVVYDAALAVKTLMADNDWEEEEALEFFEFNVAGCYMGDHAPVWCWLQ